jgi:heterodisulfide reductase subunit C
MIKLPSIIQRGGVPYEQCNQCGKCASGCPAARYLELRPRKVVLMVQRGKIDELLKSGFIWECTQCHQCMERCPRDVTPFDIIISLQNTAVRAGLPFPENLTTISNSIRSRSLVQGNQEVFDGDFEAYDRASLRLPDLRPPENMEAFREALDKSFGWDLS